jgi:hypothetical protein
MLVSVVVCRVIRDISVYVWPKYVVGCYQFISYNRDLLLSFARFNWFGLLSSWMSHCSFEFDIIFYYFLHFFLIVWFSSIPCTNNELLCYFLSDLDSLHSKFLCLFWKLWAALTKVWAVYPKIPTFTFTFATFKIIYLIRLKIE